MSQGLMFLVNDNTNAVMLAGSDLNLNGQVSVGGEVQTNARVDIRAYRPTQHLHGRRAFSPQRRQQHGRSEYDRRCSDPRSRRLGCE